MGLAKNSKKNMNFLDYITFSKANNIKNLEFPIDYFSKIEKKNFLHYFKILKKNNFNFIIDLEDLNFKKLKELVELSKIYNFNIIRIKMSNFFGGNRYLVKNFDKLKIKFIDDLKNAIKIIKKTNLKFAIENHQDLNSKELVEIIKKTSKNKVGINWDIANSLATIETPDDFFKNVKKYIINVHSKDYKIILSNEGFYLKRCIIGDGVVNFKKYISFFKKKKINFSIELGAHISRHCNLENKKFISSHNLSRGRVLKFKNYLNKKSFNENPFTRWEIEKNLKASYKDEINDVKASIQFVKKLYEKK
jgi:hypothetical protein